MSTRDVVEMLSLAHRGLSEAESGFDERLRRDSMKLLERAVRHPDAPALFGAMQLAFDENFEGNDPTVEDNGDGVIDPNEEDPEPIDEDSPAGGPANEGITDDSSDDGEATDMNSGDGDDKKAAVGHIVRGERPLNMIAAASASFARLRAGKAIA